MTSKAIYKEGRLIFYDTQEIPEDGTEVIVNFEKQLRVTCPSLRGSWSKYFPKEIDLDAQLQHFRREWEQEMEKISE